MVINFLIAPRFKFIFYRSVTRTIIRIKVEQLVFCVAVVEPAERDVGRKLVSKCPAQDALNDFLQSEAATSGVTQSSSTTAHSTGYVFNLTLIKN